MDLPESNGSVVFDPASLERNRQRSLRDREREPEQERKRERGRTGIRRGTIRYVLFPFLPQTKPASLSSRSSITAVDDPGSGHGGGRGPGDGRHGRLVRLAHHFNQDVATRHADLLLLVCTFASGMLDSAAFSAWGSFTCMQTGNVVFLALGVSGQPPHPSNRWAEALVAISTYIIGTLLFVQASRYFRALRRSTLTASFAVQTAAIVTSSILVQTGVVHADSTAAAAGPPPQQQQHPHWLQIVPIALLAFQAAGQIVTSRLVGVEEVPTLVLTTVLCDLLVDARLLAGAAANPARNRRAAMFVALFVGAMVSGLLAKHVGLSCPLWIAAGLKGAVTACWVAWWGEHEQGREKERTAYCC